MKTKVRVRSSIFKNRKGEFVLGSMCVCGHLESEHGSLNSNLPGRRIFRQAGHGNCCQKGCACPRFTWKRFVTEDEMADIVISAREEEVA